MLRTRLLKGYSIIILSQVVWVLLACSGAARDPKEASEKLLATKSWKIDQILVNDALSFKDGKMIQQFGGIDFERYMETVQFEADGRFVGIFKGGSEPMILQWKLNPTDISVTAKDQKGGAWTILPADVTTNSFVMITKTTAYDYPRMTKIALIFKTDN